jgi:hypothetical protein
LQARGDKEAAVRPTGIVLLCAGAVSACAAPDAGPARGSGADCVARFRAYDLAAATMSTPSGSGDRMPIPPALQLEVSALRSAGCLTDAADLAPMAGIGPEPVRDGGATIPPTALHAGVVTSTVDEALALGFFDARGARARSIGSAGLGRRIYLGPFATQGALEGARDLAVRAGFAAPYPAVF